MRYFCEKNVTINTAGEITVDVSNVGTGGYVYSTGVNSQERNLTLTKVGKMTVKWNGNLSNHGGPLYPVEEFDSTAYNNHVDKANCIATYTPKVAAPTATVADVTIDGVKDSLISNKEVKITLTNDNFNAITADTNVKGWFTNLPAGLDAKIKADVSENDTTATIEISGNPSETSSDALAIKIPAASLVTSTSDLGVTSNPSAKFEITTPITETLVPVSNLTGKTYTESAQEPTFSGTLTRDTDYTVSYALQSGSTGKLDSDNKPVGAGTYLVTVAGKGSYTGSFTKDFEIGKATPVYTAPTAKTGLAYTGSPLPLIDSGRQRDAV